MKHFSLLALMVLALLCGPVAAEDIKATSSPVRVGSEFDVDNLLERMSKSVLRVTGLNPQTLSTYSGSIFIVKITDTHVYAITADHVASSSVALIAHFNGVGYLSDESGSIANTDAAWVRFPLIPGVMALEANLDPDKGRVSAMSFGYWGNAGNEGKLTGTIGIVDRNVVHEFSDPSMKVIKGVIRGSQLVWYGYSGGVIVDKNLRVLGVNAIITDRYSAGVDIRYIYNRSEWWNEGKIIKMPVDFNTNLKGTKGNGWKRVPIEAGAEFFIQEKKPDPPDAKPEGEGGFFPEPKPEPKPVTVTQLRSLFYSTVKAPYLLYNNTEIMRILKPGNIIVSDGKRYEILGYGSRNSKVVLARGKSAHGMGYMLLMGDGWELTIGVKEVKV